MPTTDSARRALAAALLVLAAGFSSAQTVEKLGMEPTPPNFNGSIRAATAKAGVQAGLPARVDLSPLFPEPGYQGEVNSCVGWSVAYAVKSYHENKERSWGVKAADKQFSPSFVYNQINRGQDRGSTIPDAFELLKKVGAATLKTMPYTANYRQAPSPAALSEAAGFKAESYARLDPANLLSLKTLLADGQPIVIGMKTYENFMDYKGGVYRELRGEHLGGHAMVLVGYDEEKKAFRIINSWSKNWGEAGYCWYDYALFSAQCHTAMVLYDKVVNTPSAAYPPIEVSASAGAYADRIKLTWKAVENAEFYAVYRSVGKPGDYQEAGRTKGVVFFDSEVKPGVDYFYTIRTKGPNTSSDPSEVARGFAKASPAPGIPKNLKGLVEQGKVKLVWDPVEKIDGYYVYRWDEAVKEFRRLGQSRDEGFLDDRAPAGSLPLRYVVSSFIGKDESKAAEGVSVTVSAPPPVQPLARPEGLAASQGSYRDRIELAWQAVPGAGAYIVRRWSEQGKSWIFLDRSARPAYSDRKAPAGKQLYSVITVAAGRESEASAIAEGFKAGTAEPKPVQKFADEPYYPDYNKAEREFFGKDEFFKNDDFFKEDEASFFNNFSEEQFFFFDEKAFFKLDEEKYFGKEQEFFR